jgi:CheY-like chemotaxis protein
MAPAPATILCIDDDSETLSLRRQVLETNGFSVMTALSGADGLRLLSGSRTIDLVLLDYVMPEMAGDRVAEQLKRLFPSVPIVLVSGFPDLPETLLRNVDGYVRKGQDPDVLIGAITRALAPKQ